jgi:LysM repeat protein
MKMPAGKFLTIVVLLAVLSLSFTPAAAAPAAQGQTVHVVRWGETLASIAARYGVTVAAIVQTNHLANPNYIYVGQVLTIPGRAPAAVPAAGATYVVQWGDSLAAIAARFGVTVQALMAANGLSNPNFIYAGQVLKIPGGAPAAPPAPPYRPPAKAYYTVQWGDTLTGIAYRFGTTVEAIMQANGLVSPYVIYAGQLLVIPGGTAVPPHPAGTFYTVKRGDTLNRIAMMYGVSVWALVQVNNLANPSLIYPGQVLIIPGYVYPPAGSYPPPPPYPTPAPWPPTVTRQWVGRIVSSDCTDQDTWAFQSVLRVSVIGKKGLAVKVSSDGWQTTGLTGTKPEYGEFAVEFAPFNQGFYTVAPEGLGVSLQVRLDGKCKAYVEFAPVDVTSTTPN